MSNKIKQIEVIANGLCKAIFKNYNVDLSKKINMLVKKFEQRKFGILESPKLHELSFPTISITSMLIKPDKKKKKVNFGELAKDINEKLVPTLMEELKDTEFFEK